ncbi:6-phosphofructokinase [Candidatus Pacearchaeota archaeon]|nr:6-phosphofructokinase [Candidatus Pacearchaeota archaeon]
MKDYIAIITAGGHIASFHSGMLGITEQAEKYNLGVLGFKDGFKGAKQGKFYLLNSEYFNRYQLRAGSAIGASREKVEKNLEKNIDDPKLIKSVLESLAKQGINIKAIIGMCGDDHLKQLYALQTEEGIPVIGWPKTMDNDLSSTYFTLGYPTAAMNAAKSIRQGFDGAWTNNRIHIVTMFGRDTDWVVAAAGAWGQADLTIGGEGKEYDIKEIYERALESIEKNKKEYGRKFAVLAVGEGASIKGIESHVGDIKDIHGNPKLIPEKLALEIQKGFQNIDEKASTSIDTLTYNEFRNCSPTALDREIARKAGERCVDEILLGLPGNCVVIANDDKDIRLKIAPLPEVYKKRKLALEGFMDYENMQPTKSFINYYTPIFEEPLKKEKILFKPLEEKGI